MFQKRSGLSFYSNYSILRLPILKFHFSLSLFFQASSLNFAISSLSPHCVVFIVCFFLSGFSLGFFFWDLLLQNYLYVSIPYPLLAFYVIDNVVLPQRNPSLVFCECFMFQSLISHVITARLFLNRSISKYQIKASYCFSVLLETNFTYVVTCK